MQWSQKCVAAKADRVAPLLFVKHEVHALVARILMPGASHAFDVTEHAVEHVSKPGNYNK